MDGGHILMSLFIFATCHTKEILKLILSHKETQKTNDVVLSLQSNIKLKKKSWFIHLPQDGVRKRNLTENEKFI